MNDQLKTLITLYEEEKLRLQKLLISCLDEEDYLPAHYYSKALHQLYRRLQTLYTIDDPLYDDKQWEIKQISSLKKDIEETDSEYIRQFLVKELLRAKDTLEKLNQIQPKGRSDGETLLLNNTFLLLLDKEIKNVKLVLNKSINFLLAFTYTNKALKVTIPKIKQLNLHYSELEALQNLGFVLAEREDRLVLIIIGNKQVIINQLHITLSKIVFEIFHFTNFKNETYISFNYKATSK